MKKGNLYLPLHGRIGNQLFQYAFARSIQINHPYIQNIVIDDSEVIRLNWENSLPHYNLPNVMYVHEDIMSSESYLSLKRLLRKGYHLLTRNEDYNRRFELEKKLQPLFNRFGLFLCENGYIQNNIRDSDPIYIDGYFQSEKYFLNYNEEIKSLFSPDKFKDELEKYPNINEIRKRNTVCISVKVEHNVGSTMYDVCGTEYWKRAIDYIVQNVENPYFFICSDNVEFVLENLIDAHMYDYTYQPKGVPVHISLSAMSLSKHFIIGNTSFGWWAQYLAENKNKIVVAPSRWMAIDMPIDIYQEGWRLIEVSR